jgi:hypothetical protein
MLAVALAVIALAVRAVVVVLFVFIGSMLQCCFVTGCNGVLPTLLPFTYYWPEHLFLLRTALIP